jgi:quinohemoprotein ethanol dehydrogenase
MTMMGKGRIMVFAALALIAGTLNGCQTTDGGTIASSAATPEDGANWMRVGRTDNEDHFSPLTQINDGNVGELGLAWSHDLATFNSFTAPLAVDGVLYFATGYSVLHAMDAATGKLLWTYDPEAWRAAGHKMRAGWGIRGIAYDNGKLFAGTIGGQLIAVDARTGKPLWSVQTVDKENSAYITGAPWVFRGKVMIGFGGADYGPVRGYVTAYDQATGKQAWRFHTVPGDPSKGFENKAMEMAAKTWTGEWWKFGGGGNVWGAMAYDPKYNRVYLGTGNGWPWNQKIRSPGGGDNLFLSSIIALDADTGEYVWHYQVNPGNSWDFNNAMDIELADLEIDGKMRSVLLHAPKNGFFYVIDRATGKLLSAEKFAKVNWADRIDLQTGRPVENPEARYPGGKPFLMYPWPLGAHGVQAMSFSPRTGLVYLPATDAGRVFVDPAGDLSKWQYKPGMFVNTGLGAPPPGITSPRRRDGACRKMAVSMGVRWQRRATWFSRGSIPAIWWPMPPTPGARSGNSMRRTASSGTLSPIPPMGANISL